MKFKVGDRVRVIMDTTEIIYVGMTGIITKIYAESTGLPYFVKFDRESIDGAVSDLFCDEELTIYSEPIIVEGQEYV